MLIANEVNGSGTSTPLFNAHVKNSAWFSMNGSVHSGTGTNYALVVNPGHWSGYQVCWQRMRGAAAPGAGTGFRNRHWTTAYAASKHRPMPFKGNPAAGVGGPLIGTKLLNSLLLGPRLVRS